MCQPTFGSVRRRIRVRPGVIGSMDQDQRPLAALVGDLELNI